MNNSCHLFICKLFNYFKFISQNKINFMGRINVTYLEYKQNIKTSKCYLYDTARLEV